MKSFSINGNLSKILVGVGLVLMVFLLWRGNWVLCMVLAILPLSFYLGVRWLVNPYLIMLSLFVYTYFAMGLNRYLPSLQMGLGVDGLMVLVLFSLMLRSVLFRDT